MKRFIAVCLCFIFLSTSIFFGKIKNVAYADPFTAAQIGAAAYAAMASWGVGFTSGNATAVGMSDFMANQVDSYVGTTGGSIASVFGSQLAIDAAGKLVAGHQMYNGLVDFFSWMTEKYDLSNVDFTLQQGTYNGTSIPYEGTNDTGVPATGVGAYFSEYRDQFNGYMRVEIYNGGVVVKSANVSPSTNQMIWTGNYKVGYSGQIVTVACEALYNSGSIAWIQYNAATRVTSLNNSLSWNGENLVDPIIIDPSYEWLGQVGDYQDTNLDQLIDHIFEDVEGNNLVVVGELAPVDPPQPTPTPMPIDPETPLQEVPWEGLDTNLQNLYNQGLEEIGAIGDAQDAITDAIGVQTGALEGAIADNAGVVSGAIDQAVSDVGTAIGQNASVVSGAIDQAVSDIQASIGQQTEALDESLSATVEGVDTIAEALEDEAINWQKFDLRGLFPFCIPFDIYNMLEALDASPTAPHVELPFVIESIGFSYTIDLDFSDFDTVAAVMRQMELIVYGIALAWATSKVIKW